MPLGASFFEELPLVEFTYLVFTRMPGEVTVGDSGLCCCAPCLLSVINSLCRLIALCVTLSARNSPYLILHFQFIQLLVSQPPLNKEMCVINDEPVKK